MPLKLRAGTRIELRWWWETPPPGEPVLRRDPLAAGRIVARIAAHPECLPDLCRFLREGSPGLFAPLDDDEAMARLATAIAKGQVKVTEIRAEPLRALDGEREEAAVPAPIALPAPRPAPAEEICWPCLQRAAASARALREASFAGLPFVMDG